MGRPKKNCAKPLVDPEPNGECLPAFKKVTGKLGKDCCKLDKRLYNNDMVNKGKVNLTKTKAKMDELEPKKRSAPAPTPAPVPAPVTASVPNAVSPNQSSFKKELEATRRRLAEIEARKRPSPPRAQTPSTLKKPSTSSSKPCHKLSGKKNKTKCRERRDCVWSDIKKSCRDRSKQVKTIKNRQYVG